MSIININLLSTMVANQLSSIIRGIPTEDRVLIAVPNDGGVTSSGLFIPNTAKEELPRKGVIVKMGEITPEYRSYQSIMDIGTVVTHGLYAGKEVELSEVPKEISDNNKFMVIHVNECIFIEPNKE